MPLLINFHQTFVPERRLIAALLDYAASGKSGTSGDIASETGIPMGKSTGKLPAILNYARGMGLVELEPGTGLAIKKPILTAFGRVVYEKDRFLGERMTQWLAHLHMCLPETGAAAWHKVFAKGRTTLGSGFTNEQVEDYLVTFFGPGKNRTGPLIRCYSDDAALGRSGVLKQENGFIRRGMAPLREDYALPYAAFILSILQVYFPDQYQVTVSDFGERTDCFDACLWGEDELIQAFTLVERTGFIGVDRQMRPWIIERRADAGQVWPQIFSAIARGNI